MRHRILDSVVLASMGLAMCGFSAPPAIAAGTVSTAPAGTVTVSQMEVPLSVLMSDEAKRVLMRARPSEGPGAPVP